MARKSFKTFLKERQNFDRDNKAWIDIYVSDNNTPEIKSIEELKRYIETIAQIPHGSSLEEILKASEYYWEKYKK